MKILTALKAIYLIKNWPDYAREYFNKANKQHIIYQLRNGLKIKTRAKNSDRGIFTEANLLDAYQKNKIRIKPNDTIIDIGAHIGAFTILAAKKAKKVYSFEPHPENFKLLKENIALNNLTNITATKKAITDKKGIFPLYISKSNTGSHSIFLREEQSGTTPVQTITIIEFIKAKKIKKIGLLKIDCEGAEYPILETLPEKTFELIEQISMECHPIQNSSPEQLKTLLQKRGFDVQMTKGKFPKIYAQKIKHQKPF